MMKKNLSAAGAAVAVALLSGCAFTPQAVVITPEIETTSSTEGANRALALNVVDERPRQSLGTRGVRGVGADLTVQGDLRQVVEKAIQDGLTRKTFKVSGSDTDNRLLRVEIRNLDYQVIQGFWAGTLKVDVSLKAVCQRGNARPYEQLHRGDISDAIGVVQGEASNNTYISKAVSQAVNSLLKDEQLMRCLAN